MALPPGQAFPDALAAALSAKGYDVDGRQRRRLGRHRRGRARALDWSVPRGRRRADRRTRRQRHAARPAARRRRRRRSPRSSTRRRRAHICRRCSPACAPRRISAPITRRIRRDLSGAGASIRRRLYPFFLEGVAGDPKLNQPDGLHPTGAGVSVIVAGILPAVEDCSAGRPPPQGFVRSSHGPHRTEGIYSARLSSSRAACGLRASQVIARAKLSASPRSGSVRMRASSSASLLQATGSAAMFRLSSSRRT